MPNPKTRNHLTKRAVKTHDATTAGTLLTRWLWVRVPRDPLQKSRGPHLGYRGSHRLDPPKSGRMRITSVPTEMGSRDPVHGGWDVTETKEL
jgi:hypothetical protein